MVMDYSFFAKILAFTPEGPKEKTVLLRIDAGESTQQAKSILDNGPVVHDEMGFFWSEEPQHVGLCVWKGVIGISGDGDFTFTGHWDHATVKETVELGNVIQ